MPLASAIVTVTSGCRKIPGGKESPAFSIARGAGLGALSKQCCGLYQPAQADFMQDRKDELNIEVTGRIDALIERVSSSL